MLMVGQSGYTALHRAVWDARVEPTMLLIDEKADVNAVGKVTDILHAHALSILFIVPVDEQDGRRPLHEAALRNHAQIVGLLCNKGADVNAKTNVISPRTHLVLLSVLLNGQDGNTPLNYAANGSYEVADALLERGHTDLANTQDKVAPPARLRLR